MNTPAFPAVELESFARQYEDIGRHLEFSEFVDGQAALFRQAIIAYESLRSQLSTQTERLATLEAENDTLRTALIDSQRYGQSEIDRLKFLLTLP